MNTYKELLNNECEKYYRHTGLTAYYEYQPENGNTKWLFFEKRGEYITAVEVSGYKEAFKFMETINMGNDIMNDAAKI